MWTVPEVAARLRCCPEHVRRLIRRRELAAVKAGKRLLVTRAALDAYIAALPTA